MPYWNHLSPCLQTSGPPESPKHTLLLPTIGPAHTLYSDEHQSATIGKLTCWRTLLSAQPTYVHVRHRHVTSSSSSPPSNIKIQPRIYTLFMAALRSSCGHYIFALWFLFFPRLISAVGNWMFAILAHMVCLSVNFRCRSENCCTRLAANTGRKKIVKKSPSGHHRAPPHVLTIW